MTKEEKKQAELRAKPLFDFLDSYDARLLSRLSVEQSAKHGSILLYLVNCHMVIVTVNVDGWEMFLPASKENNVADTLKRAEEFLGSRPGDGEDMTKYKLINLDTDESHGLYDTLEEARGAVRYDKLRAYSIWNQDVRIECCDDRAKQGLGMASASER